MFSKIVFCILLFFAGYVQAQSISIRFVVPFGTGGLVDNVNRRFAEALEEELGRKILVESKPGAAGYIGLKQIATAKADEIQLSILDANAIANVILLHGDITLDSFRYIIQLGTTTSLALAVKKGSDLRTIADWRNHKGKSLMVGVNGLGGVHHYYNWIFKNQIPQTAITEVAYRGMGDMITNLVGGHIDAGWSNLASLESHEQAGKIDIVAIIQSANSTTNYPTFDSQGIRMPETTKWLLISNKSINDTMIKQIEASVKRLIQDSKFVQIIRNTGLLLEANLVDQAQKTMQSSIKQQQEFVEYLRTQRK